MPALAGPALVSVLLLVLAGAQSSLDPTMTVGALRALRLPSSPLARTDRLGSRARHSGSRRSSSAAATLWWAVAAARRRSGRSRAAALRQGTLIGTCGCFGREETPPHWSHLVLDAGLAGVAAADRGALARLVLDALSDEPGTAVVVVALSAWRSTSSTPRSWTCPARSPPVAERVACASGRIATELLDSIQKLRLGWRRVDGDPRDDAPRAGDARDRAARRACCAPSPTCRTAPPTTSTPPCTPSSAPSRARPSTTRSPPSPTGASSDASSRPARRPATRTRVGDNHHHLVCRACGQMVDVDCAVGDTPCLTAVRRLGLRDRRGRGRVLGPLPRLRSSGPGGRGHAQ